MSARFTFFMCELYVYAQFIGELMTSYELD